MRETRSPAFWSRVRFSKGKDRHPLDEAEIESRVGKLGRRDVSRAAREQQQDRRQQN